MRFGRLDLNLLVALDALISERNVSIAAERLCLSQSAMSGALGRLREFFDDELLINTGRQMVLTSRAEELAEPVRSVLLQIKSEIATKPVFDPETSDRSFRIAASDYAVTVAIGDAIARVSRLAPHVKIEIENLDDRLVERLERREVDLLITLESALSPDHPRRPFIKDDFVVVGWSGNEQLANGLDLELYQSLGHVSVQFGKARLPAFEQFFLQTQQVQRRVEVVVPIFTMVPIVVVGTQRIATCQRRLAERAAAILPINIFPLPTEIPAIEQSIQWHRSADGDQALRWLVEQIGAVGMQA